MGRMAGKLRVWTPREVIVECEEKSVGMKAWEGEGVEGINLQGKERSVGDSVGRKAREVEGVEGAYLEGSKGTTVTVGRWAREGEGVKGKGDTLLDGAFTKKIHKVQKEVSFRVKVIGI